MPETNNDTTTASEESKSTATSPETELKAGHPPAEKIAGGVRIVKKRTTSSSNNNHASEGSAEGGKEEEGSGEEGEVKADGEEDEEPRQTSNVLTKSGLAAQTKKDFPEEAIKAFHEKKQIFPQHQPPPANTAHSHRDSHTQNQPRRFNTFNVKGAGGNH